VACWVEVRRSATAAGVVRVDALVEEGPILNYLFIYSFIYRGNFRMRSTQSRMYIQNLFFSPRLKPCK
jgi:hypothetical protein